MAFIKHIWSFKQLLLHLILKTNLCWDFDENFIKPIDISQENSPGIYDPDRWELCSHKDLCMNIHSNFLCHEQNLESAQMSCNRWMVQQTEKQLVSNKDKCTGDAHNDLDESTEKRWVRKASPKDDTLCGSIYVTFFKDNILEKHDSLVVASVGDRGKEVCQLRLLYVLYFLIFCFLGALLILGRLPVPGIANS